MFKSAVIKLTGVYLLIIMAISLFFSLNLYRISAQELNNSFRRQQNNFQHRMMIQNPQGVTLQDPGFLQERDQILNDGQQNIVWQLIYTNIFILIFGGGISYLLARMTIRPIQEAHEAQVRFTGDASHELRSPLAVMKAEIEVALRDPKLTREEAIDLLKSNLEEVDKLKTLSEGLLELARDSEGLDKEKTKVGEFIEAAVKNVAKKAKAKKITININVNGFYVMGNKENLAELVTIILENAIKYSGNGTEVSIVGSKGNDQVELRVSDQGVGIDPKDLPHIFDRFYRVETSRTKNKTEGYGLGLSIAKKIVDSNHGKIHAESVPGEGTTFFVNLPLA